MDEKLICTNKDLSDLDVKMADAYRKALAGAANQGVLLRSEQRDWLVGLKRHVLSAKASDRVDLISSSYLNRIALLQDSLRYSNPVVSVQPYIEMPVLTYGECKDAIDFQSIGKLDYGKNEVGVYNKFYDGKNIVMLGTYQEQYAQQEELIAALIDQQAYVKLSVQLCPKEKDENGVIYSRHGSFLKIYLINEKSQ
ncbi:MAG TPA: hypothetical protein VN030_01385 [Cellvibrio sp.]|nr:hypothetical protein [Cellvibrio sp.]